MDWLFSDETMATLFVLAGTGLFALTRHLYDRYGQLARDLAVRRQKALWIPNRQANG
jgi:hypothetical protein